MIFPSNLPDFDVVGDNHKKKHNFCSNFAGSGRKNAGHFHKNGTLLALERRIGGEDGINFFLLFW